MLSNDQRHALRVNVRPGFQRVALHVPSRHAPATFKLCVNLAFASMPLALVLYALATATP